MVEEMELVFLIDKPYSQTKQNTIDGRKHIHIDVGIIVGERIKQPRQHEGDDHRKLAMGKEELVPAATTGLISNQKIQGVDTYPVQIQKGFFADARTQMPNKQRDK